MTLQVKVRFQPTRILPSKYFLLHCGQRQRYPVTWGKVWIFSFLPVQVPGMRPPSYLYAYKKFKHFQKAESSLYIKLISEQVWALRCLGKEETRKKNWCCNKRICKWDQINLISILTRDRQLKNTCRHKGRRSRWWDRNSRSHR